jgi:hypothetical protein
MYKVMNLATQQWVTDCGKNEWDTLEEAKRVHEYFSRAFPDDRYTIGQDIVSAFRGVLGGAPLFDVNSLYPQEVPQDGDGGCDVCDCGDDLCPDDVKLPSEEHFEFTSDELKLLVRGLLGMLGNYEAQPARVLADRLLRLI